MRVTRVLVVAMVAGAILVVPHAATADGGAYIDFDRTHNLPGSPASGVGYVSIPLNNQDLLERGPFYVYLVPFDSWIQEGRPLPAGVIRLGTATIEPARGTRSFEVRTTFTVPDVQGAYYWIQICNDPCTIAGFREPLSAQISIVQTEREAELLNEQQKLQGKVWSFRKKLRQAEKATEELQAELAASLGTVADLSAEAASLERALGAATASQASVSTDATTEDRPLVDAWALFAIAIAMIVALLAIGLALVFSRRSVPRFVVPDTIEELDAEAPELDPALR